MLKDAWALAIEILTQIKLRKLSERLALLKATKELGSSNPDAIRYAYRLAVETIRRKNLIDKFIESIIKLENLNKVRPNVESFLELYIYQTRASKKWVDPNLEEAEHIAKLGRAVLGWKTLRSVEPYLGFFLTRPIEPIIKGESDEEHIALSTFHPIWFVKYCFRLFGRSEAIAFLEGSICPPSTFVRLNTLKASQEEIMTKLDVEGERLEKIEPLQHTYKVIQAKQPLTTLASYREGLFYIQDKASSFAAEAADPKPNMIVLDVCAAPGAKTTYLSQLMQNQGTIYSLDYSARRIRTWKKEVSRMGATIANALICDARFTFPFNIEVDVAVLDPPCTSTGVFGRQPSSKWRITSKSIETMTEIQWKMINNVAGKVKSGGVFTYSTCSITVEENEMIIERFLKWHSEFHLVNVSPALGLPGLKGLTMCRRLYPHLHESNGFFIAKLEKD